MEKHFLSVCVDCFEYIAGFEEADNEATVKAIASESNAHFHVGHDKNYEITETYRLDEFSIRPCELCSCKLAGERFAVTKIICLENQK